MAYRGDLDVRFLISSTMGLPYTTCDDMDKMVKNHAAAPSLLWRSSLCHCFGKMLEGRLPRNFNLVERLVYRLHGNLILSSSKSSKSLPVRCQQDK